MTRINVSAARGCFPRYAELVAGQHLAVHGFEGNIARRAWTAVSVDRLELAQQVAGSKHREHDLLAVGGVKCHLDPPSQQNKDGVAVVTLDGDRRTAPVCARSTKAQQRRLVFPVQQVEEAQVRGLPRERCRHLPRIALQ
jgi:hypothetical protein